MIKLFASDLDGTILYSHGPDEYCLETVQKIIDDKKYFVITTGRPLFKNQAKSLGFMDYKVLYICMNGAIVRDSDFSPKYEELIPKEALRMLLKMFPETHMEFISGEKVYFLHSKEEYIRYRQLETSDRTSFGELLNIYMENVIMDATAEDIINANIIKINGRFINECEEFEAVKKWCKEHSELVNNTPYRPDWCEITSYKASKGNAVKQLAKLLGIKENEVAVFGDAENDLSMLSVFENAYVPENGTDEAKQYAKEITPPCIEHGILNKMRELLTEE